MPVHVKNSNLFQHFCNFKNIGVKTALKILKLFPLPETTSESDIVSKLKQRQYAQWFYLCGNVKYNQFY